MSDGKKELKPMSGEWFRELGMSGADIINLADRYYGDPKGHARSIVRVAKRIIGMVEAAEAADPHWDANGSPV